MSTAMKSSSGRPAGEDEKITALHAAIGAVVTFTSNIPSRLSRTDATELRELLSDLYAAHDDVKAALSSATERAEADDVRFAWLERHPFTTPMQHHGDGWRVVSYDRLEVFHGPTLREALDAARSASA